MNETKVQISLGEITLRKPKAGVRNKALMKSETGDGLKQTTFLVELLPYCISSHPFGTTPVRKALDDLDIADYDELINGMNKLFDSGDDIKNSENLSGQEDSQETQD